MTDTTRLISVIVPVYGSETILPHTYERLTAVLGGLSGYDYEIVFVNDASPDGAIRVLRELASRDERVKVLSLSRNFGHQCALTAGLDAVHGDATVVIDDDLQDPPEVIAEMVRKWEEGYKVVYGVRTERKGEGSIKRWSAAAFYRLVSRLSETPLPVDSGDFRLLDRDVVAALRRMREEARYVRGMVSWVGFSQCAVPYVRDARLDGKGNYTLRRLLKLASDGVFSFSSKPLTMSTHFGAFVTVLSFLAGVYVLAGRVLFPQSVAAPGWSSVIVAVLFMGGVQLMSIGILGEYLGRVFYETKRRPLYLVAEAINIEAPDPSGREL
jgi:glycosyltransferase involved in cell wall biosynthesis